MLLYALVFLCVYGSTDAIDKHADDRYMHPKVPSLANRAPFYNFLQDNATFWNVRAQKTLRQLLDKTKNENLAKNVILFMGDGMSIPTIAAARVYIGGEEHELSFDKFPYTGLSKTYCVDKQVPDSACTSTAYLTGIKGNYHTIGVSSAVTLDDCLAMNNTDYHSHSIAAWSQAVNKMTGFVTTARVTHASPAGVYAHTAERTWECDTDILENNADPKICRDIAYQLVHTDTGKNLNVMLGGGRGNFLPKDTIDEEGDNGFRSDGKNLIDEWLDEKKRDRKNAKYIWKREQLINLDGNVDYVLGMFDASHVPYNLDRDPELDPTLEEMVEAAIKLLRKSPNGYFLFVEGARIDTAHHEVKARKAMDEVAEFSKAIQRAVDMTNVEDTLIVVTSDHAHSMAFSGYPDRGRDVLGLSGMKDRDNMDYLTLAYANGPGYRAPESDGSRVDVAKLAYTDKDFQYPGMYPTASETHGGDDVGIYALGPWAHLFNGVMEENVIPHIMAYASCVGEGLTLCQENPSIGRHLQQQNIPRRPQRPQNSDEEPNRRQRPSWQGSSGSEIPSRFEDEDDSQERRRSRRPNRPRRPSNFGNSDESQESREPRGPGRQRPMRPQEPVRSRGPMGSRGRNSDYSSSSEDGDNFNNGRTTERSYNSHFTHTEDFDDSMERNDNRRRPYAFGRT